jgi:hypothetical protein
MQQNLHRNKGVGRGLEKGAVSNRDSSARGLNEDRVTPSERLEELRRDLEAARRYEYAEYLLRDRDLRDILCFNTVIPKNLVTFRLSKLYKSLNAAEVLVYRLVELRLYERVVISSYPTQSCKKKCVQRAKRKCVEYVEECVDVNKDIYGLQPSEELLRVCSLYYKWEQ